MQKNALQEAFDKTIQGIPKAVLMKVLDRKLSQSGFLWPPPAVEAFAEHLLAQRPGPFVWTDAAGDITSDQEIDLSFEKEDCAELDDIVEKLPDMTRQVIADCVASTKKSLDAHWMSESNEQNREIQEFKVNLEERWGNGLTKLRMLLTCCRELGSECFFSSDDSQLCHAKGFVSVRLHARACQVAEEVIVLLENGFADGAAARWRTLHELTVVSILIMDGDEDLAQRYIDHDAVDRKRAADDYESTTAPLVKIKKKTRMEIDKQFEQAKVKYGKPFTGQYGWAAALLTLKQPTFKDLEAAAGRVSSRFCYRSASNNVHAGTGGISSRLSTMGTSDLVIAGRSNAGLCGPAQNTAYSLTLITSTFLGTPHNLDQIVELSILVKLRDDACKYLAKAANLLTKQENELRKQCSAAP